MTDLNEFRELGPNPQKGLYSAEHVATGIPIPKTRRIEQFSPDEWEEFIEEWATSLKSEYARVARFAGSGDQGLDVVGFIEDGAFKGGWDNYQCKRYGAPLTPSDIWVEIGKIIYYSFRVEYPAPRKYYFVAPKGIGTSLGKLLADPARLKQGAKIAWGQHCESKIAKDVVAKLDGDLLVYFENFDFSMFSSRSLIEMIEGHVSTPFHSIRFGGGLPARPLSLVPPKELASTESRYIQQLYEAYSDHAGEKISDITALDKQPALKKDFTRQRERFYHAESLRNFARDTVPYGTYEELQEDVYQGVIDTCASSHEDGLEKMRSTLSQAAQLSIASSPLSSATRVQDKQGICHQLANEDRLIWVPEK